MTDEVARLLKMHETSEIRAATVMNDPADVELLRGFSLGQGFFAGRRRAALLRFARRLDDAVFAGAPWASRGSRNTLLSAAGAFLVGVEEAFDRVGRQHPNAKKESVASRLFLSQLLLRDTDSSGAYVVWADAILDLFARRVYGLGERTNSFFDTHAPTAG
jgi:hypothetical protein